MDICRCCTCRKWRKVCFHIIGLNIPVWCFISMLLVVVLATVVWLLSLHWVQIVVVLTRIYITPSTSLLMIFLGSWISAYIYKTQSQINDYLKLYKYYYESEVLHSTHGQRGNQCSGLHEFLYNNHTPTKQPSYATHHASRLSKCQNIACQLLKGFPGPGYSWKR